MLHVTLMLRTKCITYHFMLYICVTIQYPSAAISPQLKISSMSEDHWRHIQNQQPKKLKSGLNELNLQQYQFYANKLSLNKHEPKKSQPFQGGWVDNKWAAHANSYLPSCPIVGKYIFVFITQMTRTLEMTISALCFLDRRRYWTVPQMWNGRW